MEKTKQFEKTNIKQNKLGLISRKILPYAASIALLLASCDGEKTIGPSSQESHSKEYTYTPETSSTKIIEHIKKHEDLVYGDNQDLKAQESCINMLTSIIQRNFDVKSSTTYTSRDSDKFKTLKNNSKTAEELLLRIPLNKLILEHGNCDELFEGDCFQYKNIFGADFEIKLLSKNKAQLITYGRENQWNDKHAQNITKERGQILDLNKTITMKDIFKAIRKVDPDKNIKLRQY